MIGIPRRLLPSLHDLSAQVLERRGADGPAATVARDLLAGFFDVCTRAGQDGVLVELAQAFAPLDVADGSGLSEDPRLKAELAARVGDRARFDPGGPRNALPAQLAECLIGTLGLELRDAPERSVTLGAELQRDVLAALAGVVEVELAAPTLRAETIAAARARCEERHLKAFDKMVAQLDERGVHLPRQPKVPIDVVQATQRALAEARTAIVERVARAALDRARPVLERGSAEAAARLDLPISHRLTPRDVAVRRATEVQVPSPEPIVRALFAAVTELLDLVWTAPAANVRAYGASQTFAVGEQIEHPKFGRGTVQAATAKNIEVEFADSTLTLIHARGAK